MRFQNMTAMAAGWTVAFEADGRELLVVAVKGTFRIPASGESVLAEEQVPLTLADEFTGEPGFSAPLHETDFSPRKPRCDVIVNGSAYAPGGRATDRVTVGIRAGSIAKAFDVVGERLWRRTPTGVGPSRPTPFVKMPISYDTAFGGTEPDQQTPGHARTFEQNPVGRGFRPSEREVVDTPLPNTEETGRPVTSPGAAYAPMSFGPVGRNWWPRRRYAGTYDSEWLETRAPFWPADFDYHYFQCASEDQQVPYLIGGEQVALQNLTPDGRRDFTVPTIAVPVLCIPRRGPDREGAAAIDTLSIEPDLERFTLTWRLTLPLRKDCFELKETIVGEMPAAWHRARKSPHKRYFAGLGELVAAKRRRTEN